jgi:hypothetical protein
LRLQKPEFEDRISIFVDFSFSSPNPLMGMQMLKTTADSLGDEQRRDHRELDDHLYGKLLEVNAALKDAGGALIVAYVLALLVL